MKSALVILFGLLIVFISCSDFQEVGVSHGKPISVIPDTVVIPETHVELPAESLAQLDTFYLGTLRARDGFTMSLQVNTASWTGVDSVDLLASWAATDSLQFKWMQATSYDLLPSQIVVENQGERLRFDFKARLQNSAQYVLEWAWPNANTQSNYIVGLRYSPKTLSGLVQSWSLMEYKELPANRLNQLAPSNWTWRLLPVQMGDNVDGFLEAPANIDAYVVNSAVMAQLENSWVTPTQTLYNRDSGEDSWQLTMESNDTLYWLLYNNSTQTLTFSDSVRIWREY